MDGQFDYVVVGVGSDGCALANRLSADPQGRVALLEAGPKGHPPACVPASIASLIDAPSAKR